MTFLKEDGKARESIETLRAEVGQLTTCYKRLGLVECASRLYLIGHRLRVDSISQSSGPRHRIICSDIIVRARPLGCSPQIRTAPSAKFDRVSVLCVIDLVTHAALPVSHLAWQLLL